MALTGDLRNIGLADLFQTLNQNRATGVLEVSNKSSTKKFLFTDAGVTLISRRTLSGFRVGKRLIGLGKVTSEEIKAALALQASDGGLIGAILVANGNCTQEEIQEVIRYHVAEELFEVFTWTEGIFSFHEGGVPSEDELAGPYSTVSLDPAGAILDAARRIDECQRAWTVLPTRAEILVRTAGTSEPLDAETYSAEVRALYDLIDGARTIEEVLSSIFISQFEAVPTLVEMVDQGLIRKRTVTELKSAASVFSVRDEGESAARCLQAALAENPDDLETLTNLCAVCEKLSDKKQAAEILKRIAQLHHGKKDLTAAAADLTKAARYAPGSAEIQEQLAMVRQQANDLPGAIQAFLRAGEILNDQGSFKQAMDICTLALHLDSDNVDLHRILANSHVGAGEIDEAVEELIQIVPSIEANGSRGQIEDIYRKILKLDSSRREYLARLERVTIEGARKRKRIRLAAISGAAVLILAAVAVVVAPSGTSLVEQLAQATSMMASGDLRGAERLAGQIIEAEPDSDAGQQARVVILNIARLRQDANSPKITTRNELDGMIEEFFRCARGEFEQEDFEPGIASLLSAVDYLALKETREQLDYIGPREANALLSQYGKVASELLESYVEQVQDITRKAKKDLAPLRRAKLTTADIDTVKIALASADRLRAQTDPEVYEHNAGNAEAVETAFLKGARVQTTALLKAIDELRRVHDEVSERYHTFRATVLRTDLYESFTEVMQRANSLKSSGELKRAMETCARFLATCDELRREEPAGYYATTVGLLLGEEGLNLDGKMAAELETISRVIGDIVLAEKLIREGRHEESNAIFRSLIRDNVRIDFRNLIQLVMWIRSSPLGAEVTTSWDDGQEVSQARTTPEVSRGRTAAEGIVVRFPPYGRTVIHVRKDTFEPITIEIENFGDEHPAARFCRLEKQAAWMALEMGPQQARPTFRGDSLLLAGRDGHVRSLNLQTGEQEMDHDLGLLSGFAGQPLLVGDVAWLASLDQRLLAFDLTTRRVILDVDCGARIRTSPIRVGETVVVVNERGMVQAFKNGAELWRRQLKGRVLAEPAATAHAIYVGTTLGALSSLDPASGESRWTIEIGEALHTPITLDPAGRPIVATDTGTVRLFDDRDGREVWCATMDNAARGQPAVSDGQVWAGSLSGGIYAISIADGTIVRRLSAPHDLPNEQGPVLDGDRFYIIDGHGKLGCIDLDGTILWRFDLQTSSATPPVISNGRVYAATSAGTVFCFER